MSEIARQRLQTHWISPVENIQFLMYSLFVKELEPDVKVKSICSEPNCCYPPHLKAGRFKNPIITTPIIRRKKYITFAKREERANKLANKKISKKIN